MNNFENTTYDTLTYEFEEKLKRGLTLDEKRLLEWLAERHDQCAK